MSTIWRDTGLGHYHRHQELPASKQALWESTHGMQERRAPQNGPDVWTTAWIGISDGEAVRGRLNDEQQILYLYPVYCKSQPTG